MLTLEIMKELGGHVGYDYEELPPEQRRLERVIVCLARPKDGVEFYVVREPVPGQPDKWTEGIEKAMHLGAWYALGSQESEQECRVGMLRAMNDYGAKMLRAERK